MTLNFRIFAVYSNLIFVVYVLIVLFSLYSFLIIQANGYDNKRQTLYEVSCNQINVDIRKLCDNKTLDNSESLLGLGQKNILLWKNDKSPKYIKLLQNTDFEPKISIGSSPPKCASYDPHNDTINITCDTNMPAIDQNIHDKNILDRESDKVWILKAGINVNPDAKLTLTSNDTRWLKITNNDNDIPNYINISGKANINGVKITSWNLIENDVIEQNNNGSIPRPYIKTYKEAGAIDILNSEIGYLGYDSSRRQGISYYGGNGSTLTNNTIHDMWYGFYSQYIGFVNISNNYFYNNFRYGIDPHTGSHDFIIANNTVYNSNIGAICSLDCYRILFEGNKMYDNKKIGIMFSRSISDSVAKNNYIYSSNTGIAVSESNNNELYNNIIEKSNNSVKIHQGSSNNHIHSNTFKDSTNGINLADMNTTNNLFENNNLTHMIYAVRVTSANTNNSLVSNEINQVKNLEYLISHNGSLQVRNQIFSNDKVRGGSGSNIIDIVNSGKITVNMLPINTNLSKYNTALSSRTVIVNSDK
jgi:parallel beta-helix repeat protein